MVDSPILSRKNSLPKMQDVQLCADWSCVHGSG